MMITGNGLGARPDKDVAPNTAYYDIVNGKYYLFTEENDWVETDSNGQLRISSINKANEAEPEEVPTPVVPSKGTTTRRKSTKKEPK